jgi:hypothetical protein
LNTKERILELLIANVGRIVTSDQIRAVALRRDGKVASEWARRLRELREDEGWKIRTHSDRPDLKPDEYILESLEQAPVVARDVSARLRMEILERNGLTCQICGAGANEPDPLNPGRKTRLVVDHQVPLDQGGTNEKSNLRVICSACNAGKTNLSLPKESVMDILSRIRKLTKREKEQLFEMMKKSFSGYF